MLSSAEKQFSLCTMVVNCEVKLAAEGMMDTWIVVSIAGLQRILNYCV